MKLLVQKVDQKENYPAKAKQENVSSEAIHVHGCFSEVTEDHLLYMQNLVECSPRLPSLLRPASHYAGDCLGLPCKVQVTGPQLDSNTEAEKY